MYNKLYTYVHEIFLSTTIITFNYNYSWNFFYNNGGKERGGAGGGRGRKNEWELEVYIWRRQPRFSVFGARRKYSARTQVWGQRGEQGGGKKRKKRRERKSDRCYEIETRHPVRFTRERGGERGNLRKYIAQSLRRGKRSFGKNSTIVETKFLNNNFIATRRGTSFSSLVSTFYIS